MKYRNYILAFLISWVIGAILGITIHSQYREPEPPISVNDGGNNPVGGQSKSGSTEKKITTETVVVKEVTLEVSTPTLQGKNYSFTVELRNSKAIDVVFEVWDSNSAKKIAQSQDGKFQNIPGCKSGVYRVCAIDKTDDSVIAKTDVAGFNIVADPEPTPQNQMTAAALQTLINQRSQKIVGGKHPQISKNLTFNVIGESELNGCNLTNVYSQMQFGLWNSVMVVSVDYDENNRIVHATIQPNSN